MSVSIVKNNILRFVAINVLSVVIFTSVMAGSLAITIKDANACCWACAQSDCNSAGDFISRAHSDIIDRVKSEFDADLKAFEEWLIEVMFDKQFVPAVGAMVTQMGAVSMYYTGIVGAFLDAQIQMDTQRVFRKLQFEAHKDYRPSESFCWFGTNVRSLAASDTLGNFNSLALSKISLARQVGILNNSGAESIDNDYRARWDQFVKTYCDTNDNNRSSSGTGLELACDLDGPGGLSDMGANNIKRVNRDINYTRLIEEPRTLDLDFSNNNLDSERALPYMVTAAEVEPRDEEDVIAMSKNLYGHRVLSRGISSIMLQNDNAKKLYLALRSIVAKRGVAQASFNAIIGMKSSGTTHMDPNTALIYRSSSIPSIRLLKQTRRYMAAIMDQLLPSSEVVSGTKDGVNILDLIGYSPSYYSQLEVLAKRIYQNPDFYAGLYDTPANVSRKKVAMKAIELMVDRAIYESQLRREMNISVLLASKLRAEHRLADKGLAVSKGNRR